MTSRTDLPHVTQVLKDAGLVDTTWFTDHMRERGTALHKACELWVKGDLDMSKIDDEIEAPFTNFQEFITEVNPEIHETEMKVEYPGIWQGRLDIHVDINGVEGIVDIKGQETAAVPIQLAGYALTFHRPMSRWALYLRAGKKYKLVEYKDKTHDNAIFLAAVKVAAWRRQHGLIK